MMYRVAGGRAAVGALVIGAIIARGNDWVEDEGVQTFPRQNQWPSNYWDRYAGACPGVSGPSWAMYGGDMNCGSGGYLVPPYPAGKFDFYWQPLSPAWPYRVMTYGVYQSPYQYDPTKDWHKLAGAWVKKGAAPTPTPTVLPQLFLPRPQPMVYPFDWPLEAPLAQPQPKKKAQPAPSPVFEPSAPENPADEPEPRTQPYYPYPRIPSVRVPVRAPFVTLWPYPGANPGVPPVIPQPDTVVVAAPDGGSGGGRGPTVTTRPGHPSRSPGSSGTPRSGKPEPKVKERKINVRSVGGKVWVAFNLATEALDLAVALWKALPPRYRTPKASLNQKMADLYDHFGQIDLADAFQNWVNDQIVDIFYGGLGYVAGQASQGVGLATGLSRGINSGDNYDYDAFAAANARDAYGNKVDPNAPDQMQPGLSTLLPRIDIDPHNGIVWLLTPYGNVYWDMGGGQGTLLGGT